MSLIEWKRQSRRILLPIIVLAPYPVTDLSGLVTKALIDTGSSVSGLSSRIAEELQLQRLGKRPLTSAQGEGQVERYAFRVGLIEDRESSAPTFPYVFDEIIGIELTNSFEFGALIGMDILNQCDFSTMRDGSCALRFGS